MSGGVDSSVAAGLLAEQGHDVVGVFMRLGSPGEAIDEPTTDSPSATISHRGCCSILDAADARQVASRLGIPLYVCNFKKDFARIVRYFTDEYAQGRTPNPCVRCNDWLKFGKLHEYAVMLGCDAVASGHYARVVHRPTGPALARGVDSSKDQSYVLFGIPRDQLARTLFPIGELTKPRVRDHARRMGLAVSDKPDSQDICFVPDGDYAAVVQTIAPQLGAHGDILDQRGAVIGHHGGQHRFTIGQRRGLALQNDVPLYVLSRDPARNTVTVGPRESLGVRACIAGEFNWLCEPPASRTPCLAKVRSNSPAARATVIALEPGEVGPSGRGDRVEIVFDDPVEAVAPGQAVAVYDASEPDLVLGGGWIQSTAPDGR